MSNTQFILDLLKSKSTVGILGEAGTGKTTLCISVVEKLLPTLEGISMLRGQPHLPFMFCAFTNSAVARIKRKVPDDWPCYTIHKALEYKPDANCVTSDLFTPARTETNPLAGLQLVIVDEIGTVNDALGEALIAALPEGCKLLLTGDQYQMQPIFGTSILRHLLCSKDIPMLVLKQQHRQTTGLLRLAHDILAGKTPSAHPSQGIRIIKGDGLKDTKHDFEIICELLAEENFKIHKDILLCPFRTPNRWHSSYTYSKWIAAQTNPDAKLYELLPIDGLYVAIGDLILYRKEEYQIIEIHQNPYYTGDAPAVPGTMNRYGHYRQPPPDPFWWSESAAPSAGMNWMTELCYTLTCVNTLTQEIEIIERIPLQENNDHLVLAGSTTVHKAQGNEWERVFLLTLALHTGMCTRPLLYTAVTRAQKELIWITARTPLVRGPKRAQRQVEIPQIELLNLEK